MLCQCPAAYHQELYETLKVRESTTGPGTPVKRHRPTHSEILFIDLHNYNLLLFGVQKFKLEIVIFM